MGGNGLGGSSTRPVALRPFGVHFRFIRLVHPVLPVEDTRDHHGTGLVTDRVDRGRRGIDHGADDLDDGQGRCGEAVEGDDHQLADEPARGDAGHDHPGQQRHGDADEDVAGGEEVTLEDSEEEGDLEDCGQARALHVDRRPDRNDRLPNIAGHTDALAGPEIGGDRRHRGGSAQGDRRRFDDVRPERPDPATAAGEEGVEGEGDDEVDDRHGVVDEEGTHIVADQLGPEFTDEGREVGAQADRGVVHDDRRELEEHLGSRMEERGERAARRADLGRGDADDDREDDEGEHVLGGEDLREVVDDEGLDQLITDRPDLLDVLRLIHLDLDALGGLGDPQGRDHHDRGDDASDCKDAEHAAEDLAQPRGRGHARHRRGDGEEDERDDKREHHVDEQRAEGFDDRGLLAEEQPDDRTDDDAGEDEQREPIVAQDTAEPRRGTCWGVGG